MVVDMRYNRNGYGGGGDVGRQQMICDTMEMAKWVGRTATDWEMSTGNDYQHEGVLLLRDNGYGIKCQR